LTLDPHFSLFFLIAHHIQTTRPATITSIMIPPNHGLCILFFLLFCMETVHKHFPVVNDRPAIGRPRVDNVFSVDVRNPNSVVN
jgi:hypothetical protein